MKLLRQKGHGPKIKRLQCWALSMKLTKNSQKKIYKWAELMGSAHINTELDRADSCATSDCHVGCLRGLGRLLVTKTKQ